jgi:CRP-like cAMP-binding protein
LVRLNKQNGEKQEFKISREEMASMAGMATETVSRTLSDFKEEGLIEKKGATINITDLNKLGKMRN